MLPTSTYTRWNRNAEPADWNNSVTWPLFAQPKEQADFNKSVTCPLEQISHVTSFGSTREPADWNKSVLWPLFPRPGSQLIGTNQSCDFFRLDQGASWLEQISHVTSFGSTREPALSEVLICAHAVHTVYISLNWDFVLYLGGGKTERFLSELLIHAAG